MKQVVGITILLIGILSFPCAMLVRSVKIKSSWLYLLVPGIITTLIAGGMNAEWVVWVFAYTFIVSVCIYLSGTGSGARQKYYDLVSAELHLQKLQDGLWTRAFAEAAGDSAVARARYIQLRVAELAGRDKTNVPIIAGSVVGVGAIALTLVAIFTDSTTGPARSKVTAAAATSKPFPIASATPFSMPRLDPIIRIPASAVSPAAITKVAEELPEKSLDNGTVIDQAVLDGKGTLSVTNGSSRDALAKLVDRNARMRIAVFYIRHGGSFTLRDIPDGHYNLLFAMGNDFDEATESFQRNLGFSEFKEPFDYATKVETRGASKYQITSQFSVTLHPVVNGTAKTDSIPAEEFDQY